MAHQVVASVFAFTFFAVPFWLGAQSVQIIADHSNALYRCGEKALFTATAYGKDKQPLRAGSLTLAILPYSTQAVTHVTADLATHACATISGTSQDPGFIRCQATLTLGTNTYISTWGVGFEPEKIVVGSTRPKDFDAYWNREMRRLEKTVPLDPRVAPVKGWNIPGFDAYRVSFATFGGRVYGFLTVPTTGKPPYPVRVHVPGAGPGKTFPFVPYDSPDFYEAGSITLLMNVHPYELPEGPQAAKEIYNKQNEVLDAIWHAKLYCDSGIAASRESYFFHSPILGINRAVDWVAARPDVDLKHFTYFGSSQGGAFGFFLCALNRHITKGELNVPALTDLGGFLKGRASGWPYLNETLPPEDKAAGVKWAPYFDAAHFAPRITCPVRVTVGFIDPVCPPCAVYAAYNALRVKDKAIVHGLGMGHPTFDWIRAQNAAWRNER